MGRSLYTPSTLAYLVHTAGSSSTRSSSPSTSSLADSGTLSVGHEEIKYGQEQENGDDDDDDVAPQPVRGRRSNNKDAPTSWAERSFDPDDESLPTVTERFLGPGEEQLAAIFGGSDDDEDEEEEEDGSDYDSQDDEEEDGEHVMVETVEIERIIEEAERDASDNLETETETENHNEDDEDMPHGNGGYYDYPVQDRRSTSEIAADAAFSPSSAVFHAHTLPFSLPSTDAMQLQRRTSGNSSSSFTRAL